MGGATTEADDQKLDSQEEAEREERQGDDKYLTADKKEERCNK